MCKFQQGCQLFAVAFFAFLIAGSRGALAQEPAESASLEPAVLTQGPPSAATPQFDPTAEQIGDAFMLRQRYQAAIEAFKKASPMTSTVWNKMGIAYQMMLDLQDASRCYQASLKLNPKNAHVLNNLGTVYDSLKDYGSAERMFRRALKVQPQSALILKNLGTDLLSQHKYKKGWEVYQQALAIDPKIFEDTTRLRVGNPASTQELGAMNYYMARGCVRVGMNDRAIEYLRMALNEGFTNPRKIEADSEFAGLLGLPAFEQLMAAQHMQ
jgi:tetratricopeptide (TPR) repeat protein